MKMTNGEFVHENNDDEQTKCRKFLYVIPEYVKYLNISQKNVIRNFCDHQTYNMLLRLLKKKRRICLLIANLLVIIN